VVAILGVLAGVVVVNVVGLTGRGEKESYATDEKTIQTAVSVFYSDTHGYSATGGWNEAGNPTSVHNYPIGNSTDAAALDLYLGNEISMGRYMVNEVWSAPNTPATTPEILAAAIWMGLLTNGPGEGVVTGAGPDVAPGDNNSPRAGEFGPYLNPLPKSCSSYNSPHGTGTITWIVGEHGKVYGVFESGGLWYAGFGGRYP
jgi:type II secretory pathway pseudopilin PulG